jgi:class 3 adenylate cyclase
VLFCDLVDSTVLARQRDPEAWREVVQAHQKVCAKVIARCGGISPRTAVMHGWCTLAMRRYPPGCGSASGRDGFRRERRVHRTWREGGEP